MKLKFTRTALHDLKRLRQFIAEKNPAAAAKYSQQLRDGIEQLVDHPKLGKIIEELPNIRELIQGSYVVHCTLQNDCIYIVKIWHGKEIRTHQ